MICQRSPQVAVESAVVAAGSTLAVGFVRVLRRIGRVPTAYRQSTDQQGDPLGPLLFSLVLHKIASAVDSDNECLNLLFQAWFLDDGVIAGRRSDVQRRLNLTLMRAIARAILARAFQPIGLLT